LKHFRTFTVPGIIILFFLQFTATAQHKTVDLLPPTRILFIFDASQSMLGQWESGRKIDIARNFLIKVIDSLEQRNNVEMALRVYGHQSVVPPQDCNDTRLEVPFSPHNAGKIRQTLRFIDPKGTTPIAHSLELAAGDFPQKPETARNIIILITDGVEACDGDPCEVSLELQKKGIILKPFIIGIGLDVNFKKSFQCAGNFLEVSREDKFGGTLDYVVNQVLNETSTQVNLLDSWGNPTETNVAMTFYDHVSGRIKYRFMHTMNGKGVPDTLSLDPLRIYDLAVHTIPPVFKDSIVITPGKHTTIGLDAPQGYLQVVAPNTNLYRDLQILVKKKSQTLNTQQNGSIEKYLTGKYDLEILTLPRMNIEGVEVKQSHTTTIKIPRPGLVTVMKPASGYGSIFVEKDQKLEWVVNLNSKQTRETFTLLPGKYHLIFRSKNSHFTLNTLRKDFTVTSGKSIPIRL
jgi:Ca-activated chloride channel family protein